MSRAPFRIAAGTNRMRRAARHLRLHWPDYLFSVFGFGTDEITVSEAATRNQRLFQTFGLRSLQQIVQQEYPATTPIVEHFLSPGETGLLIARQKEGKSTFALQQAVDVSRGDSFLGRYTTQQALVLYVDYENRPSRLKERATDIGQGRSLDQVIYLAFDARLRRFPLPASA
jgi:hypothetical protein